MRKSFAVRPVNHAMSVENPSLYTAASFSPEVLNCRFEQNSLKKRWGYDRIITADSAIREIALFQKTDGSRFSLFLTDTDLCKVESTGTYSYLTKTYTTGKVASISGATVNGSGTSWDSNVSVGDKFILNTDHTSTAEPDANWSTVLTVDSAVKITLAASYVGTPAATNVDYKIRNLYSIPTNERWSWAIIADRFCFGTGDIPVQVYTGTGYASDLNATYALNARYLIGYANRLFLADVDVSGGRSAITLRWSKENDPTDWTDTTAGELDIQDTEGILMGLAKTAQNLVVFQADNIYVYARSGIATDPIQLVSFRPGVGCIAPYSPVSFAGTVGWIGRDDFYILDGDMPAPIGERIKAKFFDVVKASEIKRTWGAVNGLTNEAMFIASTTEGQYAFVFNYKHQEWYLYQFAHEVSGFGRGTA
jgi:hypothetical protein